MTRDRLLIPALDRGAPARTRPLPLPYSCSLRTRHPQASFPYVPPSSSQMSAVRLLPHLSKFRPSLSRSVPNALHLFSALHAGEHLAQVAVVVIEADGLESKLVLQDLKDVRGDERGELRPEVDVLDAEVQHGQQDGHGLCRNHSR